jgi:hypothetical protein
VDLGTALASGRILASNGNVTASAGDDFNLPAGTLIQGGSGPGSKVTIRGGQVSGDPIDPDPVGSILTIAGNVANNTGDPVASFQFGDPENLVVIVFAEPLLQLRVFFHDQREHLNSLCRAALIAAMGLLVPEGH